MPDVIPIKLNSTLVNKMIGTENNDNKERGDDKNPIIVNTSLKKDIENNNIRYELNFNYE